MSDERTLPPMQLWNASPQAGAQREGGQLCGHRFLMRGSHELHIPDAYSLDACELPKGHACQHGCKNAKWGEGVLASPPSGEPGRGAMHTPLSIPTSNAPTSTEILHACRTGEVARASVESGERLRLALENAPWPSSYSSEEAFQNAYIHWYETVRGLALTLVTPAPSESNESARERIASMEQQPEAPRLGVPPRYEEPAEAMSESTITVKHLKISVLCMLAPFAFYGYLNLIWMWLDYLWAWRPKP